MKKWFTFNLSQYKREYLKSDSIAALVVTAIAIPESLGFAVLVGLPVQTGLYCALIAPIVFALLASSRRLVVGADSATAALVAAGASAVAVVGTAEYGPAVALLTVMTGVFLVVMGLARFGFLADLISKPVLVGFISGVGLQLILTKLPDLFGIATHGTVIARLLQMIEQLANVHIPTFVLGMTVIGVIYVAGRQKLPGPLFGLAAAVAISIMIHAEQYGVKMVGVVPAGLPHFTMPTLSLDAIGTMVVAAASIAIVILAQSSATARSYAAKHGEELDDNRDLIALGTANITSALTGGFAINGSPPRTSAAESSGGRTQMVNIIMASTVGAVLLFATGIFTFVPHVALSAVVFMIGAHLIKVSELKTIWRMHRLEFAIALVSLLCVALLGVRQGVIVAVVISLIERLRREYRPSDTVLLRDGDLNPWIEERLDSSHKYSSKPKGLLIYSFDGAIFFENANYFYQRVRAEVSHAKDPIYRVIIDAGSITDLDYTGADAVKRLYEELSNDDIVLVFAHVSPVLKKLFERYEIIDILGPENVYSTLSSAIRDMPNSRRSAVAMVKRLGISSRSAVVIGGGVLETLGIRDTQDIDLVVSRNLYRQLRSKGWREYIHDDGKRVLSHRGYKIMTMWMHKDLKWFLRRSFTKEGIHFTSLDTLSRLKRQMGRPKDISDIELIKKYQKRQNLHGKTTL